MPFLRGLIFFLGEQGIIFRSRNREMGFPKKGKWISLFSYFSFPAVV
jgi:hypothetical protein